MVVVHSPDHWNKDNKFFPWEGTPQNPDLARFNVEYFRELDNVLNEMKSVGMNVELFKNSMRQMIMIGFFVLV